VSSTDTFELFHVSMNEAMYSSISGRTFACLHAAQASRLVLRFVEFIASGQWISLKLLLQLFASFDILLSQIVSQEQQGGN
jgi:hypothetical protein